MRRSVALRAALLTFLPLSYACVSDDSAMTPFDAGNFSEDAGGFDATLGPGQDATTPSGGPEATTADDAATETGAADAAGPPADAGLDAPLGDSNAPADSGADAGLIDAALANACASFAEGICGDLSICSANDFPLPAIWGDLPTCDGRIQAHCMAGALAPGSTETVAAIQACGDALNNVTITCAQFRSGVYGSPCTLSPGTVVNAGSCSFDTQCASSFCAVPPNSVCGTCQPATTAGGACASGACSAGQECYQPTSTCVAVESVADNGSCQIVNQCQYILKSTACDTAAGTCTLTERAEYPPDSGCGRAEAGSSAIVCPGSGSCSSATFPGTCRPAAPDNGACTYDGGINCLPPAVCVAGVCTLPGAVACP